MSIRILMRVSCALVSHFSSCVHTGESVESRIDFPGFVTTWDKCGTGPRHKSQKRKTARILREKLDFPLSSPLALPSFTY